MQNGAQSGAWIIIARQAQRCYPVDQATTPLSLLSRPSVRETPEPSGHAHLKSGQGDCVQDSPQIEGTIFPTESIAAAGIGL